MTINCRGGVGTREIVDNLGAIFLEIIVLLSRNKYVVPYLFRKHLATPRFPYIHTRSVELAEVCRDTCTLCLRTTSR